MENFKRISADEINSFAKPGKKILFANVPADGHFNPLTGLAVHLKNAGCDVRWYGSTQYAEKAKKLGFQYYPFTKAVEWYPETFDQDYPERAKLKGVVAKLKFDIVNFFILTGPNYYADIQDIRETFDFDIMICDVAFSAIPFVKEKMGIPVISVSVFPLSETSKDLAPYGLAMHPAKTFFGKRKQDFLRFLSDKVLFREPNKVMKQVLGEYGITPAGNVFNTLVRKSTIVLQSGSPGFEYKRSDMGSNVRFAGAVLPYIKKSNQPHWYHEKLEQYQRVVLVTQGTVEKDVNKLLVPTLEAFQNSNVLVIATTGGSGTAALRNKFPQHNYIIEDFIPFHDVMPYCNVYITNGGYGGVMLGIEHNLPMVVAGVHEGKNEINARIGYFELGMNLRTEFPKARQIKSAVEIVLSDNQYRKNVIKLRQEMATYNPQQICEQYVNEILHEEPVQERSGVLLEVLN